MDIFYTPEQISVSTTLFFSELKQNLLAAVRGTSPVRLRLYSAHDVTLMNFLIGFNLTNAELAYQKYIVENTTEKGPWIFPPYASNLLFELFKSEDNILTNHNGYNIQPNYVVRMRYNGMYLSLDFCKNKNSCSILDFLAFLDTLINPDYKTLGGFIEPIIDRSYITVILSVLLILYISYKIIAYIVKNNRIKNGNGSPPEEPNRDDDQPVEMKPF